MATKAQIFRTTQQRKAKPPKKKRAPRPRRDQPVDTALPGVSATARRVGRNATAMRNRSARAAQKGGAKLENSATGSPSRKSTRKSQGRVKRTTNLRLAAVRKTRSAKSRARKARAKQR